MSKYFTFFAYELQRKHCVCYSHVIAKLSFSLKDFPLESEGNIFCPSYM